MSRDLNKCQVIGRLGGDVEMRFTPGGSPVSNFSLASGRQWKDANGEQKEETEWFNVVVWNKLAEVCNEYLSKGSRVWVEGRIQTRSWDDTETGTKKYKTELVISDMIMLDSKKEEQAAAPVNERGLRPPVQRQPQPTRKPVYDDDVEF